MPGRPHLSSEGRRVRILAGATGVVLFAACGASPVSISAPAPRDGQRVQCRHLLDALPSTVDEQHRRDISPSTAPAAAWGEPAIVLRCGVPRPGGLTAQSACYGVNGVGWYASQRTDGIVFTTVGRAVYVEVTVPHSYNPEADVLTDLSSAVKSSTRELRPCV